LIASKAWAVPMIPPPMMTIFIVGTLLCVAEQGVYPTRRLGKLSRSVLIMLLVGSTITP
jgi:hypothetical protein